ncbi:FadR family transcriptional regulator [Pseudonocardia sp. C8]|uniref:FadR/GntR family transcriptional regulator n=1 Tax=Pseudonocardia sp. C8 TaxID=2762759 RepID=UPI0016432509|nr:FCD domain-containing protein [Pseudonocardia sp. C8]MBC3191746.1 FadR family transcriptional regulator [Pseudonocardia sp. C8]
MAETQQVVRRGLLPTHTARRILRDFHERGLEPGDGLADEATLIKRYEVSRGTLREALRLLTFLGAVTVKAGPNGGPRLATPGPDVVASAMGMVVQFRGATLRSVFEARIAVEPAVAALAAAHRTEHDLVLLDDSVDALRRAQRVRGPEYAVHSGRYHLRVAEAAHNDVLATIVPALATMTTTVRWRFPRGSRAELTRRIAEAVEAIRGQDEAAASTTTRAMIEWLVGEIETQQRTVLDSPILWPDVDEVLAEQRSGGPAAEPAEARPKVG